MKRMISHTPSFDRRKLLAHAGYASVFCILSQIIQQRSALAAGTASAKRIIFVYHPDGVVPEQWHSSSVDVLNSSLTPLSPFKSSLNLYTGLTYFDPKPGSHPEGVQRMLTGTSGGTASIDVVLAQLFGRDYLFPHVHLGVDSNIGDGADKKISRFEGGTAKPAEDDLLRAFQSLFGGGMTPPPPGGSSGDDLSLLEGLRTRLESFKKELDKTEAAKIETHLQSVMEIQKRKEAPTGGGGSASCQNPGAAPANTGTLIDKTRGQMKNMVDAMACGLSRVGTLQISHHTSESFIPTGDRSMRSHEASHNDMNIHAAQKKLINEQIAYLAGMLRDRKDPVGEGTMLDNTIIAVVTEVENGASHTHSNLPYYTLGGSQALNTGRVVSCEGRTVGSLWATLATALGQRMDGFGAGQGRIDAILKGG
jgi:hypothetical protein